MGALMVFGLASIAAIFFFNSRSNFKIFIEFCFNYKFLIYELVHSSSIFGFEKKVVDSIKDELKKKNFKKNWVKFWFQPMMLLK